MTRVFLLRPVLLGLAAWLTCVPASLPAEPAEPAPPEAEKLAEGSDLLEQENYREALRAFREADKLAGGTCAECVLGQAQAFNSLGAYRDAIKQAEAALRLTANPAHLYQAHNEHGIALVAQARDDPGKLAAAAAAFRKALELSGGKSNVSRFNLGFTLLRLSRDAEGVALLKEYLELEPQGASAEQAAELIANPVRARKRLMPDLDLVTLGGEYLTSEELRGKVVLFDFWGTWCAPCVAAIPDLRALSRRLSKDPFVLLSVSNDNDEATLRKFIAEHKMTWPQVWDEKHEVIRKCDIRSYPTYVLVSHEGEIVFVTRGWGPGVEQELNRKVLSAVQAARRSEKRSGG
jgi:tetratricopeptide (TPR) repeat protein